MHTLHQLTGIACHIVTQVVKTELVVRTKSDISTISLTTCLTVGLMLVDTIHAQSMELIKGAHPLRVTLRQVVVHGHHMYTVSSQSIQEYRQGSHQCLTFTRCHLGNLSLVEYHTTEQLHIVVYHVPNGIVSTCSPMILPNGLVTFNAHKVLTLCRQITVKISCSHLHFAILSETAGRIFHNGKCIGQHFVQSLLVTFEHLFFQLVYLGKQGLTVLNRSLFNLAFQFGQFLILLCG